MTSSHRVRKLSSEVKIFLIFLNSPFSKKDVAVRVCNLAAHAAIPRWWVEFS